MHFEKMLINGVMLRKPCLLEKRFLFLCFVFCRPKKGMMP